MLSSLVNLRLSSRKRGSDSLDDDKDSPTPSTSVVPSPARSIKPRSRSTPHSPSRRPAIPIPPEVPGLSALKSVIRLCPPKSFHAALLTRLESAKPEQISALSELLEGLIPPPALHCARCHTDYFEEDNFERSCVMDHDDNSTEVQYGETTWGCCGNVVEGEDTPAGWCYEGKHAADRSKARYRDDYDSDASQDGLQGCEQRKCERRMGKEKADDNVNVVVTRRRGERFPPSKKKRVL